MQVKSAKHTVKSKTKSILSLGAFSNFSKTARSIYIFLKIPAWNWSGSCLFCYGAWAQKESAKLQNMRACTGKTGLSSTKLVWLIQIAGWSADQTASHADVLRGSSCVPAPRTSADLSGKNVDQSQQTSRSGKCTLVLEKFRAWLYSSRKDQKGLMKGKDLTVLEQTTQLTHKPLH